MCSLTVFEFLQALSHYFWGLFYVVLLISVDKIFTEVQNRLKNMLFTERTGPEITKKVNTLCPAETPIIYLSVGGNYGLLHQFASIYNTFKKLFQDIDWNILIVSNQSSQVAAIAKEAPLDLNSV